MHRFPTAAALAAVLLLLAGCIEGTEKITLNPDGSGKCQMDLLLTPDSDDEPPANAGVQPSKLTVARQTAMGIVQNLAGVEAWSDVSFELAKDGRTHFKGTAYFKSLDAFALVPDNEVDEMKISWAKDPAGGMALVLNLPKEHHAATQPDDEAVTKAIKAARAEWERGKKEEEFIAITKLKLEITALLPGKADGANIFENVPGGVRFSIDGKKFISGVDKFLADDALLTATLKAGGRMGDGDTMLLAVYGKKGPVRAHVTGELKPLFDYTAEMEAAKKVQPEMLKKMGLIDDGKAPPLTPQPIPPEK